MTLASQPELAKLVSEVNTKVKQPVVDAAVNGPGIAVPEKVPSSIPAEVSPS